MDRNEKIRLLEAISNGSLIADDLKPPKGYFFLEDTPGFFICRGETISQDQLRSFTESLDKRNERRLAFGLLPDCMMIVFSSIPFEANQAPKVKPVQEPVFYTLPVEATEDIPVVVETDSEESEAIKPEVIKPKIFNLRGEEVDRQRAEKMNNYKHINSKL